MNRDELTKILTNQWNQLHIVDREQLDKATLQIVDDLYNLSEDVVYPLNNKQTYIIRRLYKILDDGECVSKEKIASELNCSIKSVRQLEKKCIHDLFMRRVMNIDRKMLSEIKVSSADLFDEDIKNIRIGNVDINTRTFRTLQYMGVYTFRDLLTLSIQDLKEIYGDVVVKGIVDLVHEYGLKFIDELTFEEKKKLIDNSNVDKVMNSSISFISMPDTFCYKLKRISKSLYSQINLEELIELINNHCLYRTIGYSDNDLMNVVCQLEKYGFISAYKDSIIFEKIDDLLEYNVLHLDYLSVNSKNILYHNGATKVKRVIKKTTQQIKKMRGMNVGYYNEIIGYFHNVGLVFADELEIVRLYTDTIEEKTNENGLARKRK